MSLFSFVLFLVFGFSGLLHSIFIFIRADCLLHIISIFCYVNHYSRGVPKMLQRLLVINIHALYDADLGPCCQFRPSCEGASVCGTLVLAQSAPVHTAGRWVRHRVFQAFLLATYMGACANGQPSARLLLAAYMEVGTRCGASVQRASQGGSLQLI